MGSSKEEKEREAENRERAKKIKRLMNEVSKYLQSETATIEGKTKEKSIQYFSGEALVDTLMSSAWAEYNEDLHVETRMDAVEFCTGLLSNEFFIALKLKSKKRVTEGESSSSKSKKKPKPLKFDVIIDAGDFFDSADHYYMWKYSPMGIWAYIIGGGLLLGVIAMALVPVWPGEAQIAFQYITNGSGVIVGIFFALLIVRLILFMLVWMFSKGIYHFWLLPNINEDKLGIIETFKPLYSLDNYYEEKEKKDRRKKRREAREKDGISGSEVTSATEDKKNIWNGDKSFPTEFAVAVVFKNYNHLDKIPVIQV